MKAGKFKVCYTVLQNDDGTASRIMFGKLPRELFDLIPGREITHLSEPGSGPTFYVKTMRKSGVEWWFWTEEDENGNIEGVLPPEELPALPPLTVTENVVKM